MFDLSKESGGTWAVDNVPIFEQSDDRGYEANAKFLDAVVADYEKRRSDTIKKYGSAPEHVFEPPVSIGHTPDEILADGKPNPIAKMEMEAVGFISKLWRDGKFLYAKLTGLSRDLVEKLRRGAYPNRSIEIIPEEHRLLSLALLGVRPPNFPLPQMKKFSHGNVKVVRYSYLDPMKGIQMATAATAKKTQKYMIDPQALSAAITQAVMQCLGGQVATQHNAQMNAAPGATSGGVAASEHPTEEYSLDDGAEGLGGESSKDTGGGIEVGTGESASKTQPVGDLEKIKGGDAEQYGMGPDCNYGEHPGKQPIRHAAIIGKIQKYAGKVKDEQAQAVFSEVAGLLAEQGDQLQAREALLQKYSARLGSLEKAKNASDRERITEKYRAEFIGLKRDGCPLIGDSEHVEELVGNAVEFYQIDPTKVEKYMKTFRDAPKQPNIGQRSRIASGGGGSKTTLDPVKYGAEYRKERKEFERAGLDPAAFNIGMAWEQMVGDDASEEG